MQTFSDFQLAVKRRIQDAGEKILQTDVDACVVKAIKGRYSQARPLRLIKDFAGDGVVYEYTVDDTVFPGWVDDASFVRTLEYPAGEKIPVLLDSDEWIYPVLVSSSVKKLRLTSIVPQTGKTLRVEFAAPHSAIDPLTVPDVDFEAVCDLAAAYACVMLAAAYNQLVDPVFAATTDGAHQTKSQHYLALAKKYEAQWAGALGLDQEAKQPAASGVGRWQEAADANRLTH